MFPVIYNPFGFAFTAHDGFRLYKPNLTGDTKQFLDSFFYGLSKRLEMFYLIGKEQLVNFHLDFQGIKVILTINNELVMRLNPFNLHENRFNLRREHIY